jgi:hypothetical protein
MQSSGGEFFARSTFAQNQDGRFRGSQRPQLVDDPQHRRTVANDALKTKPLIQPARERSIPSNQPDSRGRFLNGRPQLLNVEWLGEVRVSPALHGRHGRVD